MSQNLDSIAGHAYAPGFEPTSWEAFTNYFTGNMIPVEVVAALVIGFAIAMLIAARIAVRGSNRKRRRTPLFPTGFDKRPRGGTLRPKGRKRRKPDMRDYWEEDDAA